MVDFLEWLAFVALIRAETEEEGYRLLSEKLDRLEATSFSKKELSALYRIIEKHYIDYQDEEAMNVAHKIMTLVCM